MVVLQVVPTSCDTHSGLDGRVELLKFPDGTAVGPAFIEQLPGET